MKVRVKFLFHFMTHFRSCDAPYLTLPIMRGYIPRNNRNSVEQVVFNYQKLQYGSRFKYFL